MKIQDFNPIQMTRTNEKHLGGGRVVPVTYRLSNSNPVEKVNSINSNSRSAEITRTNSNGHVSFQDYLLEAMNSMNSQQVAVSDLQEKLVTNPDEVDVHDVTIAMSKAQMSLNLAQTVIDRIVTSWNEISTTR